MDDEQEEAAEPVTEFTGSGVLVLPPLGGPGGG